MSDLLRVIKNEHLLKSKKLLMLVTSFNAASWGVGAALAATTGFYGGFVGCALLCLVNVGLFANSYQKWRTD